MTAGGALIGLLAVASVLVPWYRKHGSKAGGAEKGTGGKGRNWKALAPFGWTLILGTLSSLAAGGWMGAAARGVGSGSNTMGSKLLSSLAGANSPAVTRRGIAMLTPGGAVMLVLVLLGCLLWFWMNRRAVRWQMAAGYIAGATLGPTAGLAGVAGVVLAPIANTVGGYLVGIL